jgi:predicted CXXCH cytochrome family protein
VKSLNNDKARQVRVRAVLTYPAVTIALVVSIALALTPFGPSTVMALATITSPTAAPTTTTTTTATTTASPTITPEPPAVPPTAPPAASPTPTSPTVTPSPAPNVSPSPGGVIAPDGVSVDHHVVARIEGTQFQADYLPVDVTVPDAEQLQTFRVRFQLRNAGTSPVTMTPRLEYRPDGAAGFVVVPEKPTPGAAFHVDREWVPSLGLGRGTIQGPLGEDIAVASLRTGETSDGFAVTGHRSMGANPDQPITLPSASYTEQEFTVKVSMDAKYSTGYELRVTDGGTALTGTPVAEIRLGAQPPVFLSPGQRQGVTVAEPEKASTAASAPTTSATAPETSAAGPAYPLVPAPSTVADQTAGSAVSAAPAVYRPGSATYALTAGTLSAAALASADTHGPYSSTPQQCGVCHRSHVAKAPNLLAKSSQSAQCFSCHDGLGANANVQSQYALTRPVNNPAKREYFSHDAVTPTPTAKHTRSELDEFGGLANRHSECADCHNSHKAKAVASTQTTSGWDASGRLAGVSGVSVVNGAAGTSPTYKFLSGVDTEQIPANLVTREYQLCFKCHSGATTLTSNAGLKPSQYALDKGVEFNPANPSYHPVEAAGKNQTDKMKASLAGSSPYKLWNFTVGSTIRCLNCHASSTTPNATPPLTDQAGGSLPPHTSANRGILLRNYKDRVLSKEKDAYSAGNFALCYVCHGEAPFANKDATSATNFPAHGMHLTDLDGKGNGGTDIDTAGAGQGNAICAECHFRIHSTKNNVDTQEARTRLVNFAPNVQPSGTTRTWTPGATIGRGSCTLTCHGEKHDGYSYTDD